MHISIDVVIPSYRLSEDIILPILNLTQPPDTVVRFYLVADNPSITLQPAIASLIDNKKTFLIVNKTNQGASRSRNTGIEAGTGEWILFLDDDVIVSPDLLLNYAKAIREKPGEIGFIGLVQMPPVFNEFTWALKISGLTDSFYIAQRNASFAWGTTANIMVNRRAMGDIRFVDVWGGEDVDLFIRIRQQNKFKNYACLPQAVVNHPWWNDGKPEITRFFGYGKGNSSLTERNPLYRSYDFLNTGETLLVSFILLIIFWFADHRHSYLILCFIALVILLEYLISMLRVFKYKKSINPLTALYVMLLRNSIDLGILTGNLLRLRLAGIGERFNYNGQTRRANFVLNTFKIVKLIIYLSAAGFIIAKVL